MEGSIRTKRYLQGLGTGYLATFLTIVVGLWLTPYTLNYLSREEFAIFTLASDVLTWFTLADLGLASSLRVRVAQLTGVSEERRMSEMASTAFYTELFIGVVILIAGLATAVFFPLLFNVSAGMSADAQGVVSILALAMALHIGMQTFSALLVAHQQIHIDNLLRILLLAVRTALTVGLLLAGWGLYSLAVATLVSEIITLSIAFLRFQGFLPSVQIRHSLASWEELKGMASLGVWFSIGGLAGILIEGMDRAVAAKVVTLESVTTLALTGRLYLLAYGLIGQITNTARPGLGQLIGKGDFPAARRAYERMAAASSAIALAVGLGIWAANGAFVRWWVGGQNYGGLWLDTAFAVTLIANCWVLPNRAVLAAGLVVRPQSLSRILEGILKLLISIALGMWLELPGIVGGTTVACVATSFWILPRLTAEMFKEPFVRLIRAQVRPLLLCGLISAPVAGVMRFAMTGKQGLLPAACAMSIVGSVSILTSALLHMNPTNRDHARRYLSWIRFHR